MRKFKRNLLIALILFVCSVNTAEAKFWGEEVHEIKTDQYGTICQTTDYYVFWIKVSSKTECWACC